MSDEAVAACVVPTLRAVHGADGGEWAQATIAQLVGLLEHVARRPPDRTSARRADLEAVLDSLAGHDLVPLDGSPHERAAAALVATVGRDDESARAARRALRTALVSDLDDELGTTTNLMDAFRGRLGDA